MKPVAFVYRDQEQIMQVYINEFEEEELDRLEEEGFVTTVHGKGSFVASTNQELLMEEQRKEVEADMEAVIRKARTSGMEDDEIRELFQLIMEDE